MCFKCNIQGHARCIFYLHAMEDVLQVSLVLWRKHLQAWKFYTSNMWINVHPKNTRVSITRKGSIGAQLHSGSKMTRELVSFLQTWQVMGSDWPSSGWHSASSWLISGSSLTRNGVWPQWTVSGSISDPGVFRVYHLLINTMHKNVCKKQFRIPDLGA